MVRLWTLGPFDHLKPFEPFLFCFQIVFCSTHPETWRQRSFNTREMKTIDCLTLQMITHPLGSLGLSWMSVFSWTGVSSLASSLGSSLWTMIFFLILLLGLSWALTRPRQHTRITEYRISETHFVSQQSLLAPMIFAQRELTLGDCDAMLGLTLMQDRVGCVF